MAKNIKESVEELWNGYASAILFAETDLDTDSPLDESYTIDDFDKKTISDSKKLLKKFYTENEDAINKSGLDLNTIGNDVWYTRAGHGAGFFDHSLDDDIEKKLTNGAKSLGEYPSVETYNGKISIIGGKVFKEGGETDDDEIEEDEIEEDENAERLEELADEYDIPAEVIEEYASDRGIEISEIDDLPYNGRYDSEEDYAENMVDEGVITNLSYYLEMYPTDMRIFAQEEADNRVDYMDDDDLLREANLEDEANEQSEIKDEIDEIKVQIDDLKSKLDDYMDEEDEEMTEGDREMKEEKLLELQDEIDEKEIELDNLQDKYASLDSYDDLVEKAREQLRDEYYNDIYEQLEKDAVGYFTDELGYEESQLVGNGFYVDYEKLARELGYDVLYIHNGGYVYVFSNYERGGMTYANGGDVAEGNLEMVKNQAIQIDHHAKELKDALKSNPRIDGWVVSLMDRATSNLSDITHYLEGQNNKFKNGGEIKWQDVNVGDSANVKDENKTGVIVHTYGRKFHLKFVDGSEKTYDASDLTFIKDEDEYKKGGNLIGDQYKLDLNKNGRLDSEDFKMLRGEKMAKGGVIEQGDKVMYRGNEYRVTKITNENVAGFIDTKWYLDSTKIGVKPLVLDDPREITKISDGEKMAKGGEVSKKEMIDYLNMYFDHYSELRTIAVEEDNILTKKMLSTLDDEQIKMAYEDAKYEIRSELQGYLYNNGGMMAKGGELSLSDKIKLRELNRQIKEELDTIREFEEDDTETTYDRFGNPSAPTWNQQVLMSAEENLEKLKEQKKQLLEGKKMAKGGELNSYDREIVREDMKKFVSIAKNSKDGKDFIEKARQIKNVSPTTSNWFFNRYEGFDINKSADKFVNEVKDGTFKIDEIYAMGGKTKFRDKAKAIAKKLLENKKVPKKVQKDYGKTFNEEEAMDSANRIVGANRKNEMDKKKS